MRAVNMHNGSDKTLTFYLSICVCLFVCVSVCLSIYFSLSLFLSLTHYYHITTQHIPSHHITSHHTTTHPITTQCCTFISPFIATTALTLVVDFGLLMSEFLKRNCLLRLLFSMWSMSVTYTVPPPVSLSPSLSPSLIVLLSIFFDKI